jgi:hypothetical protein
MRFSVQLLVAFGAFFLASAVAGLAGADSLGIALSFGQIAFMLALAWLLLRASPSRQT